MSAPKPPTRCFLNSFFAGALLLVSECAVLAQSTGATGGGQSYTNIKPSLALHYVLCWQGQFPALGDGTLAQVDRSVPIIGEIRVMAFSNTPTGFVECHGQLTNIILNTALFTLIGTNYGGNGFSTFGIPDFRGTVPIGVGQGPGLPNYALAQRVGTVTNTLNITNLPTHTHGIPSGNTGSIGGGAAFSILQPSLAVNFLIDANGEIIMYAGDHLLQGFARCDGSLRDITNDAQLYSIIGTTYGGDGITTFALPDLRGRSPVGTGATPAGDYALGQQDGAPTVALAPSTMPSHNHSSPSGSTGNTGGGLDFDNRQPTLAMTWMIAETGNAGFEDGPIFFGEMRLNAGTPPTGFGGWLLANGTILPIAPHTILFGKIFTNYGGNGFSTFAVPKMNGRMAASVGNSFSNLGVAFDQSTVTLNVNTIPSHAHALPVAPTLAGPQRLTNDTYQFTFTNVPDNTFTVLTATNAALPLSNWTTVTAITNSTPGLYQFTFAPTNEPKRFYAVGMPQ